MTDSYYGIAVQELGSDQARGENSRALFETMSGIKSVIGTLALEKAAEADHDIDTYTMTLGREHYSNGSSTLKYQLDPSANSVTLTVSLRSLISLNTAESDCVATNGLIDYLGGKSDVNKMIQQTLGLQGMWLVTDKLHFPGVDHRKQPFQVGAATMLDFVQYYQTIWSPNNQWQPLSKAHGWHQTMHRLVPKARLLGVDQAALPADLDWSHKTGSATDQRPTKLYRTVMDAGRLTVGGRVIFVAAAKTLLQDGLPSVDEVTFDDAFAKRNKQMLADFGLAIRSEQLPDDELVA